MSKDGNTREKILQAALQAFALHGYVGARVEKIANKAGITKASLYFHFKSKEELFRELYNTIAGRYFSFLNLVMHETAGMPLKERLIAIYTRVLSYNWDNVEMDFWNKIYYLPPEPIKEEIFKGTREDKTRFVNELSLILEEATAKDEISYKDSGKAALTFYYLITCITLSTDIMNLEEALSDMSASFDVFWSGINS